MRLKDSNSLPRIAGFWLTLTVALTVLACAGAPAQTTSIPSDGAPPTVCQFPPSPSDLAGHGGFTTSMCLDRSNRLWFATESDGVYCYDPAQTSSRRWKHYTVSDGLGDDSSYALCCDRLGRIWAGASRTGVSVFNGKTWKNYDQATGPIGGHVSAMAASPRTGDVWIATENGLSRYSETTDRWQNLIRPSGVLLSQISCLAFNSSGDIVAGTQDDGILIGSAQSGYQSWDTVPGPSSPSISATGSGLPSSQINCIVSRHDGLIVCGTHDGIASSADGGITWSYVRGADYQDKRRGLYASRVFDPTVSAIELLTQDDYANWDAPPPAAQPGVIVEPHKTQDILIAAADAPTDQFGVHITCDGGNTNRALGPIDSSGIRHPAPGADYQGEREGEFIYHLSQLTPNASYELRLHFSELDYVGAGDRVFSVLVNGQPLIENLDIYEETGKQGRVLLKEFAVKADPSGSVTIQFMARQNSDVSTPLSPATLKPGTLMSEDYVSSLAFAPGGKLYVGHWKSGVESCNADLTGFAPLSEFDSTGGAAASKTDFALALLPTFSGSALIGAFGGPLHFASSGPSLRTTSVAVSDSAAVDRTVPFPSEAKPPTAGEIDSIAQRLAAPPSSLSPGSAVYLGADWSTQGDWVGRYGSRRAVLVAASSPFNHDIANDFSYTVSGRSGPNRDPGDQMRAYLMWERSTDPRVLYDPVIGNRRESEWDDHGEAYALNHDGPGLWLTVDVPAGIQRVSFYFMNKDGHGGANRLRDYLIQALPYRPDIRDSMACTPLAEARARLFWNGVYESFAVCGPTKMYFAIQRNNSFNTTVAGVFFDKISGPATPYESVFSQIHSVFLMSPVYADYMAAPSVPAIAHPGAAAEALKAWPLLDAASSSPDELSIDAPTRMLLYRALAAGQTDPLTADTLSFWRRRLPYKTSVDAFTFGTAMAKLFADEEKICPSLATGKL